MANATKTDQATQGQSIHLLKRCLKYFRPYKGQIFLSMLAMGVVSLSTAGSAWLVKPALDEIFINKDEQALLYVPLLFFVLTLVKGAGRYVQNYFMQYSGLRVLEKLRSELYDKIIYLPLQFYEESQVGMLMSRIINDVTMIRNSLPSIVMMVRQLLTMLGLVGVVFYQNPRLAVWAVLVLPAALYPLVWFGRKLRKYGRRNQSKLADISVVLQEVFSGIRVVKAFATERHEARRFDDENERLARLYLKQASVSELSSPIMELIGAVGIGLVIWFGGHEVIAGESTAGTFFSFVAALAMMYDPVKSLNSYNMEVQRALAGAERVFEILDAPELTVEQGGDTPFDEPFRELRFEGVTFTYGSKSVPALDNVSLTVRAGERVAIVGPSGAGKSTFVNLIPRFYEPQQGDIVLNGRPVADYTLDTLRHNVSMVSQDTFLFNLPVRDNITYGLPGPIAEDTVRAAATSAYADEFIRELPDGYDTLLGERGVKLSGGQKQRLTIARAIMKDAPLLILDEATSALDSEAERIVQKALDNLMENRTSIVIAHRLSTILSADRILVMEQGRIVDAGRHEELLDRCPLYARLYAMQFATDGAANAAQANTDDTEQGAATPTAGATA